MPEEPESGVGVNQEPQAQEGDHYGNGEFPMHGVEPTGSSLSGPSHSNPSVNHEDGLPLSRIGGNDESEAPPEVRPPALGDDGQGEDHGEHEQPDQDMQQADSDSE